MQCPFLLTVLGVECLIYEVLVQYAHMTIYSNEINWRCTLRLHPSFQQNTCAGETNVYGSLALCMQVNVPMALFPFLSAPPRVRRNGMTTRPTPSTPRPLEKHTYLAYDAIVTKLRALSRAYPNICSTYTAQEKYNLPTAGKCGDKPCKQWVVVVGNKAKHVASTPELFFSGALHGNERVGPTAVVELVEFLVSHYGKNEFVTRMVDSRLVVAMPMPNAWGYYRSMREELSSDRSKATSNQSK